MKQFLKSILTWITFLVITILVMWVICFMVRLFIGEPTIKKTPINYVNVVDEYYKAELNHNNSDVLEKSGIDTETLESILPKSISLYSADFVKAEKITGVNALYLCAIAGLESGWNTSNIAKTENNMFGLTTDEKEYLRFDKPEDSIYYTANMLKVHYLNPYGKHYKGDTIEDIGKSYCPERPEWGAQIEIIKNQLNVKFNGDL